MFIIYNDAATNRERSVQLTTRRHCFSVTANATTIPWNVYFNLTSMQIARQKLNKLDVIT